MCYQIETDRQMKNISKREADERDEEYIVVKGATLKQASTLKLTRYKHSGQSFANRRRNPSPPPLDLGFYARSVNH